MPAHPDDGSPFFQLARTVLQQASFSLNIHIVEPERIISHYDRVQHLLQTLIRVSQLPSQINVDAWINAAIQTNNNIVTRLDELKNYGYDEGDDDSAIPYTITVNLDRTATDGRPIFSLPWDTITAYRKSGHTWSKIANVLSISSRTLHRHRLTSNYHDPHPYSTITDDELDTIVQHMISQTSGVIGSQLMISALQDQGHRIHRRRIRASMARLDTLGNLERWANMIPRSVYSVKGPNSLWHMDGNLKLRDYGFVLHGTIDGYSRRIIYLECNTNNRVETVLSAFLDGVSKIHAVPQRIRADKGQENRDVALWMLMTNGVNRGSFITGRSVHNQRIERLWRDVNRWLTTFHLLFSHFRHQNWYDPDDEIDRFSLIFIYHPLIQRSLRQFTRIWNHHKLRTEHNRTPIQLYADGNPESLSIPETIDNIEQYGVDWEGPVPVDDDEEGLAIVEPPNNPLADLDWGILSHQFRTQLHPDIETLANNIISAEFNYGLDMYLEVREWIENKVLHYND